MSPKRERTAFADALRIIGFRDLTRRRLEDKLLARDYAPEDVSAAVTRCVELGYVDDHTFGVDRAGAVLRRRPCGRLELQRDLQLQGLPRTMIGRVVEEAYEEAGGERVVLAEAVRRWIERNGAPVEWPAIRRCSTHLGRRGFAGGDVQAALSRWLDEVSNRAGSAT